MIRHRVLVFAITALLSSGCASSAQTRLCTALGAAGAGLTAAAKADQDVLLAEVQTAQDRTCGALNDQTALITCAEEQRAKVTATHKDRYHVIEQSAAAQQLALQAHAQDCGGGQ